MVANWLMEVIHNIVLLHAVTLLVSALLTGLWFTRTERNDLFVAYLALQACLMLWLLGKLIKTVAPFLWLRWSGVVVQYLGTCFLGPALFVFAWRYCLGAMPPRVLLSALGGASAVLFALVATNGRHHLFYTVFTMYRDSFGPVWTIITYLTFGLVGASCLLVVATINRAGARGIRARLLFIAAIAIPCAAFFYYPTVTAHHDGWKFDITPVFFGFSFLLLGAAVFKFGLLDLVRCAFNQVMEGLNDGIVLTDRRGRTRYANSKAPRTLPALRGIGAEEVALPPSEAGPTHAYARAVRGRGGRQAGTVYRFTDHSRILARQERYARHCRELDRANRDLSLQIQDRRAELVERYSGRLASELHDVIGHSLTLALALLDAAARAPESGGDAVALLDRAEQVIRDGMDELDQALEDPKGDDAPPLLLSRALGSLPELEDVGTVEVDLQVEGAEEPVSPRRAEQVKRIFEECLTNSIRHGRASRVQVMLGFRERKVELDILDNGGGCDDIRRGNGLRDIAERIRSLDGSVRFSSGPERGFRTRLWFPAA